MDNVNKSASMMKMLPTRRFKIFLKPKKDFDPALEKLELRQRVAAVRRCIKRPRLCSRGRLFWILLFRFGSNWQQALIVVKPQTVVRWHKRGVSSGFGDLGSNAKESVVLKLSRLQF